MKKLKITSVFLAVVMLMLSAAAWPVLAGTDSITFGMLSDTHNGNEKPYTAPRLQKAVNFFNSIEGLSLVGVAGDMTNEWGLESDYQSFQQLIAGLDEDIELIASMGNHEANTAERFEQYTGCRPNAHYVVNGYHFIAMSPGNGPLNEDTGRNTSQGGDNYSFVADWAVRQMQAAVADDPNKPVFVLMHHALDKTHYLTDQARTYHGDPAGVGDGTASIFSDFPQAVVFSGHIHTPNNDPRSIWQNGGFTTVNVPALDKMYLEASGMILGQVPPTALEVAQCLVVEAVGPVVTIRTYDLEAESYLDQVWTFDVSKPQEFPYTAARAQGAQKPVFDEGASLTAQYNGDLRILNLSFDQARIPASGTVGEIVYSYRFDIVDRSTGQTAHTFRSWSDFWFHPMPDSVGLSLDNSKLALAPKKEYTLNVYPTGSFGLTGDEFLTADFDTMSAEEPFDPDIVVSPAELMNVDFSGAQAVNKAGGGAITAGAGAAYTYDTQLYKHVANFDGQTSRVFSMPTTTAMYNNIAQSMSVEATFKVTEAANGTGYAVVSNMEGGGFGFIVRGTTGKPDLEFWLNIAGTYQKPIASKALTLNTWHHAVATYDGSAVRLFIDGEQAAAVAATGSLQRPGTGSAFKVFIGADVDYNGYGTQNLFKGAVSEALLYSRPLTKNEVKALSMRALGSHHHLDITRLAEMLDNLKLLNEADYNADTWAALGQAIDDALAVMADQTAVQADIDGAYDALLAALNALGSAPIRTNGVRIIVKEVYGMWEPVFRLSEIYTMGVLASQGGSQLSNLSPQAAITTNAQFTTEAYLNDVQYLKDNEPEWTGALSVAYPNGGYAGKYFQLDFAEDIIFSKLGLAIPNGLGKVQGIKKADMQIRQADGKWVTVNTDVLLDWQKELGSGGYETLEILPGLPLDKTYIPAHGIRFVVKGWYNRWGNNVFRLSEIAVNGHKASVQGMPDTNLSSLARLSINFDITTADERMNKPENIRDGNTNTGVLSAEYLNGNHIGKHFQFVYDEPINIASVDLWVDGGLGTTQGIRDLDIEILNGAGQWIGLMQNYRLNWQMDYLVNGQTVDEKLVVPLAYPAKDLYTASITEDSGESAFFGGSAGNILTHAYYLGSQSARTVSAFIAVYSPDKKLLDCRYADAVSLQSGIAAPVNFTGLSPEGSGFVRLMLWEDQESMKPLAGITAPVN